MRKLTTQEAHEQRRAVNAANRELTRDWTEADWRRWLERGARAVSPTGKELGNSDNPSRNATPDPEPGYSIDELRRRGWLIDEPDPEPGYSIDELRRRGWLIDEPACDCDATETCERCV